MAYSKDRQWAKLVLAYDKLNEKYKAVLQLNSVLKDDLRDSNKRITSLKNEARGREKSSLRTMERVLARMKWTARKLYEADEIESAERVDEWVEEMYDTLTPIANVKQLVELLEGWLEAAPEFDSQKVSILYMNTLKELNDLDATRTDQEKM